jgi:hypothetical protein
LRWKGHLTYSKSHERGASAAFLGKRLTFDASLDSIAPPLWDSASERIQQVGSAVTKEKPAPA